MVTIIAFINLLGFVYFWFPIIYAIMFTIYTCSQTRVMCNAYSIPPILTTLYGEIGKFKVNKSVYIWRTCDVLKGAQG